MPETASINNPTNIRVLYVEDDEGLARLLQKRLGRDGFIVDTVLSGEDALVIVEKREHDVILLDYTLPGMSGLDVLKRIDPVEGEPIIIMLTAGGNEYLAVEALQNGAEDYLTKDIGQNYLELLPHVIRAAVTKLNLRKLNQVQQDRLKYYISEIEKRNMELMQEVQERKELEIELREAKDRAEAASVAKSEFLANMSHEIRTPMNAVVGLSNILARSSPLTDRQKEFISTLQISAESLLDLINDLLDISRIEAYSVEFENIPFRLDELINGVSSMMKVRAEEKKIYFTYDATESLASAYQGDPARLKQIILNLCSNAVKFTEHGGVTITTTRRKLDEGREEISIHVKDTGIGIPQEKIKTVFDKFVQADSSINRKYGGTGLGLAITKTLTEAMGGRIDVESVAGKGSVFTLTLPFTLARN